MLLRTICLLCVLFLALPAVASEGDGTGKKAISYEWTISSEADGTGLNSEGDGTGVSSESDGTTGSAVDRPFFMWRFGWLWSWFGQVLQ